MKRLSLTLLALLFVASAYSDDPAPAVVGADAPDFAATGIDGKEFKLSDKLAKKDKNIILLFSRAHW